MSVVTEVASEELEALTFLDLDRELVDRELEREEQTRRSGPAAENIVRDIRESSGH